MLEDCLLESRPTARARKPATLAISVFAHGALAAALILIPLFQTPLLPQVAALLPLRPPAALGRNAIEVVPTSPPRKSASSPVIDPTKALTVPPIDPIRIIMTNDASPADGGIIGAVGTPGLGNDPNGSIFSLDLDTAKAIPAPRPPAPPSPPQPPPAKPEPVEKAPLKVGTLEPSKLLRMVQPIYPRLASITKVEGAVMLEAVIMKDGSVDPRRLKVISGHVLLVPAAVEAVQQWRYRPTVLNEETIEILATITVNFTLRKD